MEAKFGFLENRVKTIAINRDKISQSYKRVAKFDHKMKVEIFGEMKTEPVDEELRR
jgi:hypothetical protein